jgi:hypothetical protein
MKVLRQTDQPLFPDLIWSRPENRLTAGKLVIIGGQSQAFHLVAESYASAYKAGAGTLRVIMPESTKSVTQYFETIEYAPANSSGSFSSKALPMLVDASLWSDGTLLAGNQGRSSETTICFELLTHKYPGLLTVSVDAFSDLDGAGYKLCDREQTILVLEFHQLQKLGTALELETAITRAMTVQNFSQTLYDISLLYPCVFVTQWNNMIYVAHRGQLSITPKSEPVSMVQLSAKIAVWSIQNPSKLFEATTTATYQA